MSLRAWIGLAALASAGVAVYLFWDGKWQSGAVALGVAALVGVATWWLGKDEEGDSWAA